MGLENPGYVKPLCCNREDKALVNVRCRCMWKILEVECVEEMQFVVVGNVSVTSIVLCRDRFGKIHPQERIQVL